MKYKKKLNAGHIVSIVAAVIVFISYFLPYAKTSRTESLQSAIKEADVAAFGFLILGGSVLAIVFSLLKLNILCIIDGLLIAGFNILLFVTVVDESNGRAKFKIGAYLVIIGSVLLVISSIVALVMNIVAKKKFRLSGGATMPQMSQQYAQAQWQQPQMNQQYAQPQWQQPQMNQQYAQPQMSAQAYQQYTQPAPVPGEYKFEQPVYDEANYVNPTAQNGDDTKTTLLE